MNPNRLFTLVAVAAVAALTGCAMAPNEFTNAPVYNGQAAYQASQARVVTVESVHPVKLKRNTNGAWQAIAAPAMGGVIGGVAGNAMGGGKGKRLTTVIGAALGTAIGSAFQEAGNEVPGYVYNISYYTSTGKVTATVPQEADSTLQSIAPGWRPGMEFPMNVKARFTQGAGGERVLPL